jgi:hypothetical protein
MARFDDLVSTVDDYQKLAGENYTRVRRLAEELREGLCAFIGASDGACVRLVPPAGTFEARDYGDDAFSLPPAGFRPLSPILFGVAVRVSRGIDWMRVTLECQKSGKDFVARIVGGTDFTLRLPLADHDPEPFYNHVFQHVIGWFQSQIEHYQAGDYGKREIGFDISREPLHEADASGAESHQAKA